jgi:acetyl-CoA carboxylase carboxyltransferase component
MADKEGFTDWQPEIEEIEERRRLAAQMGGEEAVARHHAAGKLTVRERIERLVDTGSFHELGSLAGRAEEKDGKLVSFRPANFVMGTGAIDGRKVVVGGEDFTVRGGAADAAVGGKWTFAERMADEWRLPIVRLIDGTGGSVRTLALLGRTYIPDNPGVVTMAKLLGTIPVVSAVMGSVAGLPAAKAVLAHWTIMVKDTSQVFVAGPPVVRRGLGEDVTKEVLGSHEVHAYKSGVVDNVAEDEDDCFRQIRRFLSYLPSNVWQTPPRAEPTDDPNRREEALLSIIPRNRRRPYDIRVLLTLIVDRDSLFEITPHYGRSLVTTFARLNGYAVGLMANDPMHLGGALDAAASEKLMRFVDLCDTFHLPVVNFVDQPGFMVGTAAELQGTIRKGTRALCAVEESTVPWIAVMIRKCYGVAGGAHGRHGRLNLRYAWPSAEWGSLPVEGGVEAAYRREIEAAPDPDAKRRELEEELNQLRSPLRTAEAFGVEEMIDPRDTRPLLCRFVEVAQELVRTEVGPKWRFGMRP